MRTESNASALMTPAITPPPPPPAIEPPPPTPKAARKVDKGEVF
jgi:hypothetical protein